MTDARLTWLIEVCRFCGRLASWPFCEHRARGPGWCTTVTVAASPKASQRLREGFIVKGDDD